MQIKVKNGIVNSENFKGWTKEDFVARYKGKLGTDINEVWDIIEKDNPKPKRKPKAKEEPQVEEPKEEDKGEEV